ncbi:MAG TPA: DUF4159 domain-containing protein [Phycisphaeraceae bacterium]
MSACIRCTAWLLIAVASALIWPSSFARADQPADEPADEPAHEATDEPQDSQVRCANLVYADGKTSVCFSDEFLKRIEQDSYIRAVPQFFPVQMESAELFDFPFSVMTGDGSFTLTPAQRDNLRQYLLHGGFVVASASCSSKAWNESFKQEIEQIFPGIELEPLPAEHPVFHTVYDITSSRYKSGKRQLPRLEGLTLDGRIVLIWSPDGLNDTANAGPSCCCCGGNEIKEAQRINVNLLAYALTH